MKTLKEAISAVRDEIRPAAPEAPASPSEARSAPGSRGRSADRADWSVAANLPVARQSETILKAIRDNRVFILTGETGSGKSTQLPKLCVLAGRARRAMIAHTQPRRIAAISLAARVSEEIGRPLGEAVGFKVRFQESVSRANRIRFMTDGVLLTQTQGDPDLSAYDTIIIDEAHERSLNIDFLLGYLKTLLKRRKDLKVIVTSATIDAERFAAHFADDSGRPAPIVSVSGRTYPVEIRYRPVEESEDEENALVEAVDAAVSELMRERAGDILVFLPGEAEIRQVADKLSATQPRHVEILALYARLSVQNQAKVFHPSGARRIILSTNVAETSVTVPGIRFVVDTGLARIKRYSYRLKVDRLLVEPVSRAALDQRAGRCGRVADGIAIRLFSEEDYAARAPFSDPEILRTNLAGVILRMKSLKLGDIRQFDFVQAPPARAIADGLSLLKELDAIGEDESLTPTGRTMAGFPLDPRLSRILLEAEKRGALKELLVICAALSVDEPRERPAEAAAAADAAHEAFRDERSDFSSYLKLWDWYGKAYAGRKTNRSFADELKKRFLSPKRLREWKNVHRELSELASESGWRVNPAPAPFEEVHISLLSGLLGNVGTRILEPEPRSAPFAGTHGVKFFLWPGSSLVKSAGKWVMADELVETTRLYARCVATIDPRWIETVGAHLVRKSWSEPHWEKNAASVMALERGTLYGLTVYAGRKVNYSSIDPALCRELFIRQGLVEGQFDARDAFYAHNRRLVAEIESLEHKARRFDVLVDDEAIFAFYDEIIPEEVFNGASFEAWRKKAEKADPKLLFLTREKLLKRETSSITYELYPKSYTFAGNAMALSYHFEPGSPRDGVTLTVPLAALNAIDEASLSWLVPGMLKEKVASLLKSLPQRHRRAFVPVEAYAAEFVKRKGGQFGKRELLAALIEDVFETKGVRLAASDFKTENIPAHLFMNYKVVDDSGRQLDMGRNLSELKASLAEDIRKSFENLALGESESQALEEITSWNFGELPEIMEVRRKGLTVIGYPALVDRGSHCTLEVFDEKSAAAAVHRKGLVRLVELTLPEQMKYERKGLRSLQQAYLKMLEVPSLKACFADFEDLVEQTLALSVALSAFTDGLPGKSEEFDAMREAARGKLHLMTVEVAGLVGQIVAEALSAAKRLKSLKNGEVAEDVAGQLSWLFAKDFLTETPFDKLRHYPRYLKAVALRIEKLPENAADRDRMLEVRRFVALYEREVASRKGFTDAKLEDFRWALEELRVSFFAQRLKTPYPVSVKRLDKIWQSLKYGR